MPGKSLIDGLRVRMGYCSRTTAAISIVALRDTAPVSITCSGGSPAITTPLTGLGDDHPTYGAGQYAMFYAKADITGLSPGTLYTYTVTQGSQSVGGSFRTMPAADQPYALVMSTCEHAEQFTPVDVHAVLREYCESQDVPVYAYLHPDDLHYTDSMRFWGYQPGNGQDSATGLALSNTGAGGDPQDTGLAWDYAVTWAGYFGLLSGWAYTVRPSRMWWHQNMPMWAQWGDHEVASNWQRGHGGQGDWYGPREWNGVVTDADFAPVGTANFFENVAQHQWRALFGQCMPPRLSASGEHWGCEFGPVAFVAVDMNTFADGRHGLTTGTGSDSGRQADGTVNAATGDTTLPYLGTTQIGEVLDYFSAQDKPFNIMLTSNGIASHNEPWGQWWVDDFDDLMTRASTGVLNNSRLNGTTGKLAVLKGDTHALHVCSYHADGTAGGLGGASHSGKELWEICPGTLNGSGCSAVNFQYKLFRQKLRAEVDAPSSRGRGYHGIVHVIVHADETPQRVEVRLIETTRGVAEVVWSGEWRSNVAGNAFIPPDARAIA